MATKEYEFSVILSGIPDLTDEVLDRLYEAGCDDAMFGERDGVTFADFTRQADSLREAVITAIRDVQKAGIGARVVHVEPDEFVTMSEIARRLEVTREGVRKWVLGARGPGRFPPPAGHLSQKSPLWRWTDVVNWFRTSVPERADRGVGAKPQSGARRVAHAAKGKPTSKTKATSPPRSAHLGNVVFVESATDVAALNAALDLLRYVGSERAVGLLEEVAGR
jgi:hypothetical protein